MKECSSTQATAIVTLTVKVHLTQPWNGDCTLDQIQKQARRDAEDQIQMCLSELNKRRSTVGKIQSVQIVLNREDCSEQ